VLAVHAGVSEIAMADRVVCDLARAWPAVDPDGVAGAGAPGAVDSRATARWPESSCARASACRSWSSTTPVRSNVWWPSTLTACGSREALVAAVRHAIAQSPDLEVEGHVPSEAIARHAGAGLRPAPTAG
jgi:hypothetical protein